MRHGGLRCTQVKPRLETVLGTARLNSIGCPIPIFNQDNLRCTIDEISPEGELGMGVLDNKNAGGFAALSYASTNSLSDFYLEAWIHAQVTRGEKGPLNGIAFRIDTVSGNFYRLATQFMGAEPALSLAYVGRETNPQYLKRWRGDPRGSSAKQRLAKNRYRSIRRQS